MDNQQALHAAADPDDLRTLLSQDHARLDRLFKDLLCAFEADAQEDVARLWNEFDTDLRAHLAAEEEHLLPKFVDFNAPEALALLREHQRIRDKMLQLGVGVDLHLTRHDEVNEFVRELRAHAKREDALMYQWAQRHIAEPEARRMIKNLLKKH